MFNTNEYFDGNVKSVAYENEGGKYTIGVMADGEYEFGTSSNEEMTVVNGILEVKLPGASDWKIFTAGTSFNIKSGDSFNVKAKGVTAYLCRYY
ncbi:MAG: pyrimidine/purine nucleoside phosphorylase [Cyclobacteriaceae bacterium]